MATLLELIAIYDTETSADITLLRKISAAVFLQAEVIRLESAATTNHANRLIWAKQAFQEPTGKAREMYAALLAANETATQTGIRNATDSAIKTAVANAVDIFATGS